MLRSAAVLLGTSLALSLGASPGAAAVELDGPTAAELDRTVRAARMILGDNPAAPDGSIEPTLLHISEAARSVRILADYLDAHPESLIKGRSR